MRRQLPDPVSYTHLGPHWAVLDPIAAVTVSFFIMRVSIRLLVPCLDEMCIRDRGFYIYTDMVVDGMAVNGGITKVDRKSVV